MTTPAPGGGGGGGGQWWVLLIVTGHFSQQYSIVQSPTRPAKDVVAGPFASKAEAQAWINQTTAPQGPGLPNPLSFLATIGNIGHWAGIFVAAVTDPYTYFSLGWLFLGFGLLVFGIVLWILSTKTARSTIKGGVSAAGTVPLAA